MQIYLNPANYNIKGILKEKNPSYPPWLGSLKILAYKTCNDSNFISQNLFSVQYLKR